MACNAISAFKFSGNDGHVEVSLTVFCAFMPDMQMTLIRDQKFLRIEFGLQFLLDRGDPVIAHGNANFAVVPGSWQYQIEWFDGHFLIDTGSDVRIRVGPRLSLL